MIATKDAWLEAQPPKFRRPLNGACDNARYSWRVLIVRLFLFKIVAHFVNRVVSSLHGQAGTAGPVRIARHRQRKGVRSGAMAHRQDRGGGSGRCPTPVLQADAAQAPGSTWSCQDNKDPSSTGSRTARGLSTAARRGRPPR